jgi:hypothetical protein
MLLEAVLNEVGHEMRKGELPVETKDAATMKLGGLQMRSNELRGNAKQRLAKRIHVQIHGVEHGSDVLEECHATLLGERSRWRVERQSAISVAGQGAERAFCVLRTDQEVVVGAPARA